MAVHHSALHHEAHAFVAGEMRVRVDESRGANPSQRPYQYRQLSVSAPFGARARMRSRMRGMYI